MKIRTEEEFQDYLDKETSWRKKELTAVKANIASSRRFAKNTALRSGVALLYAHWEGMIKNVATYYLCYISYQNHKYSDLKQNFLALSMKEDIKNFDATNKSSLHNKIVNDIRSSDGKKAKIPYEGIVKTGSNLKSEVFIEIMETIGLDYKEYEPDFMLLDEVLLKMRNEIAHGERLEVLSLDEDRFDELYEVINNMMNKFVTQVENAVYLKEYLVIE
jgi:hypothetical protein